MNATAHIPTPNAKRYLGQFVKHFAHKLPFVRHEDNAHGEVEFPLGLCTLDADDTRLSIIVNAGSAGEMDALKSVVDRHLIRFAFREDMTINWS